MNSILRLPVMDSVSDLKLLPQTGAVLPEWLVIIHVALTPLYTVARVIIYWRHKWFSPMVLLPALNLVQLRSLKRDASSMAGRVKFIGLPITWFIMRG